MVVNSRDTEKWANWYKESGSGLWKKIHDLQDKLSITTSWPIPHNTPPASVDDAAGSYTTTSPMPNPASLITIHGQDLQDDKPLQVQPGEEKKSWKKRSRSRHAGRRRSTIVNITSPDIKINHIDSTEGLSTSRIELYVTDLISLKQPSSNDGDLMNVKQPSSNDGDLIKVKQPSSNNGDLMKVKQPSSNDGDLMKVKQQSSNDGDLMNVKQPSSDYSDLISHNKVDRVNPVDMDSRTPSSDGTEEVIDQSQDHFSTRLKSWFYDTCWVNSEVLSKFDDCGCTLSQVFEPLTRCFSGSIRNVKKLNSFNKRGWECSPWKNKKDFSYYKSRMENSMKLGNLQNNLKISKVIPSKLCKIDLKRNTGAINTYPTVVDSNEDVSSANVPQLLFSQHNLKRPQQWVDNLNKWLTDATFRLAERRKNEGNEYYKRKDYREALKLYAKAIEICPDCAAYYSNRSACYMMLGKYSDALADARQAVRLDNTFVKGYIRVGKCNVALGDATAALSVLKHASELEPSNQGVRDEVNNAQNLLRHQEDIGRSVTKDDYRTAIFHLDRALELAVGCKSLKTTKAEYLVFLSRYQEAQEIVNEILQFESGNADAIYVRGMCLYYQDNQDSAFNHFQHVLRLAPDHQRAKEIYKKAKALRMKKDEGNQAFNRGQLSEAYVLYTEALTIDPNNKSTNSKLYFNRATVGFKLNKLEDAVNDCTAAINLDETYVKAFLRRAKCYQSLDQHEEAVRDYEKVFKLDRNQENKRLLQDAKMQLKKSKRKDYYKILGVVKTAGEDEIKKSYRKMALVHHPDRHANSSEKDKREHEIKFKEIGEAYAVLTDNKKRAMYDRGQDVNDPEGGFGHEDFDPDQIFQAFFGENQFGGFPHGGSPAGGFTGGFPGGGYSGGSFPGGFHFQFS